MSFFRRPACDFIVVGLGNPGKEYEKTRHNIGFCALELLAGKLGVEVKKSKFQALTATCNYHGKKLLLMKPQTYMNASGLAVSAAASFYHVPPEHILVMFDDVSLPPGKVRVRPSGSAGGHNGIKSIIFALGSDEFPRVKIGVGEKPRPEMALADWVLGQIPKSDRAAVDTAVEHAADAALCVLDSGWEKAAAQFNGL